MNAAKGPVQIKHLTTSAHPDLSDRAPKGLRLMLAGSLLLLLVGRNSSSSGRAGAEAAARDLWDGARELRDEFGFDVTACLPTIGELTDALMDTAPHRSVDPDGATFINRFVVLVLADQGLVLSVSAGSAMKLDADGRQPHAEHLRILLSDRDLNLGGFYAKRQDRGTRDTWATKVYLRPLENLKERGIAVWAARDRTEYALDGSDDINVFVEGMGSNSEARTIVKKRLTGARRWTATQPDENGWIAWGVGRTIPPGMMRLEVKNGRSIITFDTPEYPDQDLFGTLLPDVRDADGQMVDQVANVRWFWEHLPALGLQRAMRELCRRRYSTQTLRDRAGRGPGSYFGSPEDPFEDPDRNWDSATSWSRSLLRNLDFYKTGELTISLKPGQQEILITGVIPPDGLWMTPAVADAVDDYLGRLGKPRSRKPNKWSWSGFPVTVNGVPGELHPPHDVEAEEVRWRVAADKATDLRQFPALPDSHLMTAITSALIAANGQPLRAALTEDQTPQIQAMLCERDRLADGVRQRERNLSTRHEAILATDEHGAFLMPASFRAAEMAAWEVDHDSLERLKRELGRIQHKIAEARDGDGVEVQVLERILDELREPRATRMRNALRDAVSGLELTYRRISNGTFKGFEVQLEGELLISHQGEPYQVPFRKTFATGAVARVDEAVAALATSMRHGVIPSQGGRRVPGTLTLLARRLGVADRGFTLGRCQDPDLMRLGMAALHPDPVAGEDPAGIPTLESLIEDPALAAAFGDMARLARNVRAAMSRGESRWLIKDGAPFETWAILAGANLELPLDFGVTEEKGTANLRHQALRKDRGDRYARWTFNDGQRPTITPCAFCAGRLCAPMRIREVEGLLCLDCRRDEGGVTWPDRFDAYLPSAGLWQKAGVVRGPTQPTRIFQASAGAKDRVYRPLAEISLAELDVIAEIYVDGSVPVREIVNRHHISPATLYAIRAQRGLPHRYGGMDKNDV